MKNLLILTLIVLLSSCQTKESKPAVETPSSTEKNERPAMKIALVEGETLNVKDLEEKFVLVLFQPDCDHCQHEAHELQPRLGDFKNYTMYFVSTAAKADVIKFSNDYNLKGSNIKFGTTDTQAIFDNFGPIPAPSVFIYNEKGKLIQSFKGQTEVQKIVEAL